jgi:hypothetical protein
MSSAFVLEERFALPAFLPPPNGAGALARFGALPRLLERADSALSHRWPVPWLGDHFEAILRLRATAPGEPAPGPEPN